MIVDGKKRQEAIQDVLRVAVTAHGQPITLAIVSVGNNAVTEKYLSRKRAFGESIGVSVVVHTLSSEATEEEIVELVEVLARDVSVHGIVVQLPLPPHIDGEAILTHIPKEKDPDALGVSPSVLSPVVEAVKDILTEGNVSISGKNAVVVGKGKLVGLPVFSWLQENGAVVTSTDEHTSDTASLLQHADIIVSGAGVPGLITPEMIQEGVVLIDAGTSDVGGKLLGDALSQCSEKASIFTPVPGGVGPIAVAMLFKNLVSLVSGKRML